MSASVKKTAASKKKAATPPPSSFEKLKNLAFLREFLLSVGIENPAQLARWMSYDWSVSGTYRMFISDDMKISKIEQIANAFGRKFDIRLYNPAWDTSEEVKMRSIMDLFKIRNAKYTGFILEAMFREGLNFNSLAKVMDMSYSGIYHIFTRDDAFYSFVQRFAQRRGLEIKIEFPYMSGQEIFELGLSKAEFEARLTALKNGDRAGWKSKKEYRP